MIVCVCQRVSDRQIRAAAADGAHSLECLQIDLGVAMQCGNCADCAQRVLCEARAGLAGVHAVPHAIAASAHAPARATGQAAHTVHLLPPFRPQALSAQGAQQLA